MCADHGGADDVRQRPIAVSVNGHLVGQGNALDTRTGVPDPLSFPVTGSWTEWGEIFVSTELTSGHNTVTLSVTGDSGPNIDFMRVRVAVGMATLPRAVPYSKIIMQPYTFHSRCGLASGLPTQRL